MAKMQVFEPAMCCPTGLCGVAADPELLRMSAALRNLKRRGIVVDRFNLTSAPQEFISNDAINRAINEQGVEVLPITALDGKVVLSGRYPTNEEIAGFLGLPVASVSEEPRKINIKDTRRNGGCGCGGSNCS
jgi:hypothetical protein